MTPARTWQQQFVAARLAGVPILAIETADQQATLAALAGLVREQESEAYPVLTWDCVLGVRGVNPAGAAAADGLGVDPTMTQNLVEFLALARKLPAFALLAVQNAQRFLDNVGVLQATANLRDPFKTDGRTLALLGPSFRFPPELDRDVVTIIEPLPTGAEVREIVATLMRETEAVAAPSEADLDAAVEAAAGSGPRFTIEQITSMCLSPAGLDVDALWEHKRAMIGQTPGLSVWRGGETFADVGGVPIIKGFLTDVFQGREPPHVVVFIDEVEKGLAGIAGDTSGTAQGQLGQTLVHMTNTDASGLMFVGPGGSAKSLVAKAAAATFGRPTIALDYGAMRASLVGETDARTRAAFKVVDAVAQGRALFIATSNKIAVLPPELLRRFTLGTYFFDLPGPEERAAIWAIYLAKFRLEDAGPIPPDEGWTGADIRRCCQIAYRLRRTLAAAAEAIVPTGVSAREAIEALRVQAEGTWLSASAPGVYRRQAIQAEAPGRRKVRVADLSKNPLTAAIAFPETKES